jgi:hypothetical protein
LHRFSDNDNDNDNDCTRVSFLYSEIVKAFRRHTIFARGAAAASP